MDKLNENMNMEIELDVYEESFNIILNAGLDKNLIYSEEDDTHWNLIIDNEEDLELAFQLMKRYTEWLKRCFLF